MVLTEANIPFDDAIDVDSVAQEHEIVGRQRCDCGGKLQLKRQSLLAHEDGHYDLIEVQCEACHEPRVFLFDVSDFFDQDSGLARGA